MVITLGAELAEALAVKAREKGVTPELLAVEVLRARFLKRAWPIEPRDEWEGRLLTLTRDCGVSLSNEPPSSEGLYD